VNHRRLMSVFRWGFLCPLCLAELFRYGSFVHLALRSSEGTLSRLVRLHP